LSKFHIATLSHSRAEQYLLAMVVAVFTARALQHQSIMYFLEVGEAITLGKMLSVPVIAAIM
jgi:hypothetical protein